MRSGAAILVGLALIVSTPSPACGQGGLYPVTIVAVTPEVAQIFADGYRRNPGREVAWCATEWAQTPGPGYTLVRVSRVEPVVVVAASRSHIEQPVAECVADDGSSRPIIHSHPAGSCQASPDDRETILTRLAPFDGVLCGERAIAWYFSSELVDALRGWRPRT